MKLGFIGFGEVGSQISRGLKGEGLEGIVAHAHVCSLSVVTDCAPPLRAETTACG